ncbi:uncharacterized protein LOC118802198 isoform X2 [Colossoma macropomum]|uniref:uncharacterized protein LOC118802198 isoform X2 n=1 Tax=Colossoma macropomum TaxID=42526 RepID=UPI001864B06A|nr:uncharacterized protein LOC118802198 isoform X2 [Colossoma macropomum]
MRVSVVLLLFFFCCVQLQRGDDQLVVGDVQLLNKSHVESSEPDQTSVHPDVWTELRELRNMVAELKKQNTALEGRVVSTEVGVEALREENAKRSPNPPNLQSAAFNMEKDLTARTPYWFSAKRSQILETHSVQSQVFSLLHSEESITSGLI